MPGVVEPDEPAQEPDAPALELPLDKTPPQPYTVIFQAVDLDVNFREKAIQGRSDIYISTSKDDLSEVFIDARQSDIDVRNVKVSYCSTEATYVDPYNCLTAPEEYCWSAPQWHIKKHRMRALQHRRREELSALDHDTTMCCRPFEGSLCVKLPSLQEINQNMKSILPTLKPTQNPPEQHIRDGGANVFKISVPFSLRSIRDGLHFVGASEADTRYPHVYTRHSAELGTASSIFPCIDDPGCRCSWEVSITFPRTLGDAFEQPLATQHHFKESDGLSGNRKRKAGDDEPRRRGFHLAEEDKLLEMTVVCSGYLSDELVSQDDESKKTMIFSMEKNTAAQHIGFAVGPFEHVDLWSGFRTEEDDEKLGSNATKIHGYCLPGRAEDVRNTAAPLVTAVDYFAVTFGRYPFDSYKICFVDDLTTDSVPLCAFSMCSTRLQYPREIIDTEIDTTRTLVHSLAAQWSGINIVPNKKADIWLVVGIAWYMTDLFMKRLCGNNEFRFRMKTRSDRLVEIDMNRPSLEVLGEHLHLGSFEVEFMNLKAPLVLFILDRRLSKSSGSAGITRIVSRMVSKANTSQQPSDEVLTTEMFRKACEKIGQTRLESFWTQWIRGSGCPRLNVHQKFNKKRLCVEMGISQVQDIAAAKARPIDKDEFWREVVEENHAVYAGELQHSFTGPMTIRIHEADGTPYEHIVDIREDAQKTAKFEIPYNTKYKRLKRNRRQRERAIAGLNAKNEEDGQEDSLLYCLGDVLQGPEEMRHWQLQDWDEGTEQKMDQESYEWIRMDADFEWLASTETNLPPYMVVSQLQQDRDVAAQQESMLFLKDSFAKSGPHPVVSSILTRTLVDPRYYYGIRTMAAEIIPWHVGNTVEWLGLGHLERAFQQLFGYVDGNAPRPNDFSDKPSYYVQCAIPDAIARVRGGDGKCPRRARCFILEQIMANDNSENIYSDEFYVCRLISALATSMIPTEKKSKEPGIIFADNNNDDYGGDGLEAQEEEEEEQAFRRAALEQIERFRRMDEYSPSFQNCYTMAAMDALCRLMKAEVIPLEALKFIQYLQDKTIDVVRIKAFECLVELGLITNARFVRFFLVVIGSDPSPYVRDRLFRLFCRGLASIATGEYAKREEQVATPDGLLVQQDSDKFMEARQKEKARKENMATALAALKQDVKDDEVLQHAIWEAVNSPVLSVAETRALLEICSILFEEEDSLILTFRYPKYWTAQRGEKTRGRCLVDFKSHFRTKPRTQYRMPPPPPPRSESSRRITLNLNRSSSINAKTPATTTPPQPLPLPPASAGAPLTVKTGVPSTVKVGGSQPLTAPHRPSNSGAQGASSGDSTERRRDSIPVKAPQAQASRTSVELPATEPQAAAPKLNGTSARDVLKSAKSRKRQSSESIGDRPSKIIKLRVAPSKLVERFASTPVGRSTSAPRRSKVVTLKFTAWDALRLNTADAASIRATPKQAAAGQSSIVVQSPAPAASSPPQAPPPAAPVVSSSPPPPPTPQHASSPTLNSQSSVTVKVRKPLPSAAPHASPPQPAAATTPTAAASKPPTKVKIKLATKPAPT